MLPSLNGVRQPAKLGINIVAELADEGEGVSAPKILARVGLRFACRTCHMAEQGARGFFIAIGKGLHGFLDESSDEARCSDAQ